jgi:hypothetical protein
MGEGVVKQDTDDLSHPIRVAEGDRRLLGRTQLQT